MARRTAARCSASSGQPAPQAPEGREVLLLGLLVRDADRGVDDAEVVHGVLQRPLRVALQRRAPLGLVGVEQRGSACPCSDGRELPGQVVHVLDGARQPQPAGRRMAVRRVAGEEHATLGVAVGHDRLDRPAGDLVDLHREVGDAERRAHVRLDLLVGLRARVVDGVVEVDDPLLRVAAPALGSHRHHHDADAGLRGHEPAQEDVVVLREFAEVGGDVHRRGLRDDAQPDVRDPDEPRDGAPAVGADEVAAAHDGVLAAGIQVADRRGDARRRPAPARSARGRSGSGRARASRRGP